jgi:hypothetical protein
METVAVITPRWTAPQSFLEGLALDLAVGEPRIACRTLSLRPMLGRSPNEARNFVLRAMADLCGNTFSGRPVPVVGDRRGFVYAAESILELSATTAGPQAALLAHGVEHLPVEVLLDLAGLWANFSERAGAAPRPTLLMAGAVENPAFHLHSLPPVELADYAEAEAAAALFLRVGAVEPHALQRAVFLSGGIPQVVQAVAAAVEAERERELPENAFQVGPPRWEASRVPVDSPGILRALGALAEELRLSVVTALSDPEVAGRFFALGDRGSSTEEPLDRHLVAAGLARRSRAGGRPMVELRSPLLPLLAP